MASAHSTPTSGGENKAAIVAQIDPVDGRFLYRNAAGRMRLLGSVDLLAGTLLLSHVNVLSEYVPHNISDSDFTLTGPAIMEMNAVLTQTASQFGFNSTDNSNYQNKFRDRLLTYLSAVRLLTIYGNGGLDGVVAEITKIKVKLN